MKYFALLLSVFLLLGCQDEAKFDRVNAFNQYGPDSAPHLQYIKKQIIKIATNNELESVRTEEYDKTGRLIFKKNEGIKSDVLNAEEHYDYQNNKFSFYSKLMSVSVIDGDLTLDSASRVVRLQGIDKFFPEKNNFKFDSHKTFKDGKLISSTLKSGISSLDTQVLWDANLVVHISYLFHIQNNQAMLGTADYTYSHAGKLEEIFTEAKFAEKNLSARTVFTDYNEHGDWTKALIYRYGGNQTEPSIMTREIEYF